VDDAAAGVHFAALDDAAAVGSGAVARAAPPWDPFDTEAWRLRGMATAPERRGEGIGAMVVAAIIEHVAQHGGGVLWCNARTPAVSFYERAGFVTRGEEWVDPVIGPHIVMWRAVP
jgi:GNAT superfamily N-acetyltransferase